jgi:hypothetical protein
MPPSQRALSFDDVFRPAGAEGRLRRERLRREPSLELLGKELGMFVEHSENRNVNYTVSPEIPEMTLEEWEAEYCKPQSPLNA